MVVNYVQYKSIYINMKKVKVISYVRRVGSLSKLRTHRCVFYKQAPIVGETLAEIRMVVDYMPYMNYTSINSP